ncbi:phosphoesterase [Flavobacteriaceae bacterium TP-CH-4]|uniref:Phosphoesterase n=1 Tax=Pelagihabitans pacificus TaxID=2696054 RepID=A0A967AUJ6_9FLAO|nr:metallophosphoesterase [Pelagihabitans pacificus]NHF60651.1 phosphoesterase [Pelagihabitans pacificus]
MKKYLQTILLAILLTNCATYKTKYGTTVNTPEIRNDKKLSHTYYLIGDAGLSPIGGMNPVLRAFKQELDQATENSTAIFLGDNIYPAGLPDKKDSTIAYRVAKSHLDAQLNTLENYKGRPLFIPGNHDWYNEGLKGLERQEDYIKEKLEQKNPFLPENGCPLEVVKVNEQTVIIAIDTEWYLADWNKHPTMNDECDIKSRIKFWEEIEGAIKKNIGKTTIVALHHPMFTYGPHGGQFSLKKQFYPSSSKIPLPILGSVINLLRKTTGASREDQQNKRYREFKNRMVTLAQYSDKVIFTSGHEHTLQYIVENNTPQIVSGSGAKKGMTRLLGGSKFSTGHRGYAVLEVYTDGSSLVNYFGVSDSGTKTSLFTTQVLPPDRDFNEDKYDSDFPAEAKASIYTQEEIDKSGFFKTLWGERYRKYYGAEVTAPTVNLDTLFGGLTPVRKGGGHQSKSLRLRDKSGREYVMRALRKLSELYLQAMVFQDQYIMEDLEDTYLQAFMQDFYTGAHPYAPFTIGPLADAIDIYHTNPVLYYVPKQPALEDFNKNFGNELYMIEEHAGDDHGDQRSFGYSDKLISTDEMFEDLRDDEKYEVDAETYIRARLFDMILGDWDRHVDQWRWARFKKKGSSKISYRPMPRDRDMAYSVMGDGLFMGLATRLVPPLRLMEGFDDHIRNVKGFNSSPKTYVLDNAILSETTREQWQQQAKYIQENLTPEIIDKAFKAFPTEVRDETVDGIKRMLLSRTKDIAQVADTYFGILNRYAVVTGTDKDDWFEVMYLSARETEVKGYRIIDGKKKKKFFEKIFFADVTKEIWIYGLDDEDRFEVKGVPKSRIKVRLIGGQNNDIYDIREGAKTHIYDYRTKKNSFKDVSRAKVKLTDDYVLNTYQPLGLRASTNQIIPTIGFNPDDGIKIGASNTYTYNGFRQNPFTQQHLVNGAFYFATSGFELGYQGEFAHFIGKTNLELAARFTSPNFAINFFGFGNETENFDDELDLDFNRVKLETLRFSPSLVWRGALGSKFKAGISYESIEVEETENRFINTFYQENGAEASNDFIGMDAEYTFENRDNSAFPTIGMATSLQAGFRSNVDLEGRNFGYIIPTLAIDHKLVPNGRLVFATKWKAHFIIGDGYEFYQAASIGGVDGLRGFRNQRFTGKKAYYQNTDFRLNLGRLNTGILPTAIGLYGGFDYGRVWLPTQDSGRWHTSYGGGFFLNAANVASIRTALFGSDDGLRFTFGIGFGF